MFSRKKTPQFPSVTYALIGSCDVKLWGLSSEERLARQLSAIAVRTRCAPDEAASASGGVLMLRVDHLFQDRSLVDLLGTQNTLLTADETPTSPVVAAYVTPDRADLALDALTGGSAWRDSDEPELCVASPRSLSSAYLRKLRKLAPPKVWPIRVEQADALERYLFGASYKGVTDIITKWLWPTPARWVTRWCARRGITPNAVTSVSLILTLVAIVFFAVGWFWSGLLLAWVMTFLDTVDGKLARVTVTSTQFGNLFDHIIDIVGPPLWYVAWAFSVTPDSAADLPLGFSRTSVLATIIGAYTVGRLVEGAFNWGLASFAIFIWRPVDSYFRLIIARRNPNLILLTVACALGRPDAGIVAVAVWTVLCSVFLAVRLAAGALYRLRVGVPRSWIDEVGASGVIPARARPFL